jgi:hypothetical protein
MAMNFAKLPELLRKPWGTRNYQRPSLARRGASEERTGTPEMSPASRYAIVDQGWLPARPMDQRIESFLGDVLELAGEDPDVVHDEVRAFLSDYEAIFRAQESNRTLAARCAAPAWPRSYSDARERGSQST